LSMHLPLIPAVIKPTVMPREEVYGARSLKDVTDEFKVIGMDVHSVPGPVIMKLQHIPCGTLTYVALHVDAFFNSCGKGYQIASIIPLKIVEEIEG